MTTNKSTDSNTSTEWIGPWILAMAAIGAFFTTSRSPFIIVVFAVTIICGIWACIHDDRERRKRHI